MRCKQWMLPLVFLCLGMMGCRGSDDGDQGPSPATSQEQGEAHAGTPSDQSSPSHAVAAFLEAVRLGNDQQAEAMFTPLARQRVGELNIQVAPRGSDTASYKVGKVKYLEGGGARVQATWTDLGPDGQPRTDDMIWVLRKEQEGWRVAGMAATVFAGEPPLLLDFENPRETLQKLDLLREELQRRSAAEALQAQQPDTNSGPVKR